MKLIAGLGNPGAKYRGTRHNMGFAVLDLLARRASAAFESARADALVAKWRRARPAAVAAGAAEVDTVLLAKPLTFMNASGAAVGDLLRYFKIEPADLLVIVDEVQLPLGRLRARTGGSAGGHNGLKSVIAFLGEQCPRLRVGVGRGDARRDLADHVLSRFDMDEASEVDRMTARAADAADTFVSDGIEATMNRFNASDDRTAEEETR